MATTQFTGKNIKDSSVDLTVDVAGALPVANGGTGGTTAHAARGNLFSGCRAERLSALACVNGTDTAVPFTSNLSDNGNYHSITVNTTRFTIAQTGWYIMEGGVEWAANATGRRQIQIKLNGTTGIAAVSQMPITTAATATQQMIPAVLYPLTAGDYVEMVLNQSSGASLNTVANSFQHFSIVRI